MSWAVVLILVVVIVLVAVSWVVRQRNQIQLKIQPVRDQRLDDTPEPNEIIGSVRVRPREAHAMADAPAAVPDSSVEPVESTETALWPLITLRVMPREMAMPGQRVLAHLLEQGCHYGAMSIFHAHSVTAPDQVLFSVAQATEPGTFDLETLSSSSVHGLTLFLQATGPDALGAFDRMLRSARALALALDGEVLDAYAGPLTETDVTALRQQLIEASLR